MFALFVLSVLISKLDMMDSMISPLLNINTPGKTLA
nr:MAG TPA: hypothetical protein [Caudoviricetes sp.]DAZ44493.1 MAG TPA: hypothetical protein [Caudoviricetes sp.]DAZ62122.1 MAG TPA: hypothetical protein [Caudoviricetes sp.]